jgi:eukaryotic-like serine/threonine-protein kinase
LSNSLLIELNGAIQQIPGSTGAQKVLVASVLKHLDRMTSDAHGDRQTQLDLASAYTQLATLHGGMYVQNPGDNSGGLASINKAIALSGPFAGPGSRDREALHVVASAQIARSGIISGSANIQETVASTRQAIANFDRMEALPGVTSNETFYAAGAYNELDDELGLNTLNSMNDLAGAVAAYRTFLELNRRSFAENPNSTWAKQGQAVGFVRIAEIEMQTDPAQALKDIDARLQFLAQLPREDQGKMGTIQTRNGLLVSRTYALVEMGRYSEANAILSESIQSYQHMVAANAQDPHPFTVLSVNLVAAVYN